MPSISEKAIECTAAGEKVWQAFDRVLGGRGRWAVGEGENKGTWVLVGAVGLQVTQHEDCVNTHSFIHYMI